MDYVDALPVGAKVGLYTIESVLGQGGFGIVYRAQHPVYGRVALKEFFPKSQASRVVDGTIVPSTPRSQEAFAKGVERLLSEGAKLKSFKHRNIVRVIEVFEQNRTAYLVMEEVDGQTLLAAVESRSLVPDKAMVEDFAKQLLDALGLVHSSGLIHRDLAPDNILVDLNSGTPCFVLIDFGGAKRIVTDISESSSRQLTKTGFSAPEQYGSESVGGVKATPATDIYGLAAILYWLVSGNKPIDAPNRSIEDTLVKLITNSSWVKTYGRNFLSGVDHGLTLRPGGRPASAEAFRKILQEGVDTGKEKGISKWLVVASLMLLVSLGAWAYVDHVKTVEEAARIAEKQRTEMIEKEKAEAKRIAEEEKAKKDAEAKKIAEEEKANKDAEAKQIAEEEKAKKDAEAKRIAEEEKAKKDAEAKQIAEDERIKKETPVCRTINEQQEKCKTTYHTQKICEPESSSDTVTASGSDWLNSWFPSKQAADRACSNVARQRLRHELRQQCNKGTLSSIDASCDCNFDSSSPSGASCDYEASADCERTKDVCRNEQVPEEKCWMEDVPREICEPRVPERT
ncbi:protein kinase [Pseudomonas sp. C32]|uniref:protein kinase domain-containing protein n=1 Tax=Pseudomonas sp. C32 TaxID=1529208 RepID=UPI0026393805|nr:protein kinase [Pseudomonas sp. C32]MDN4547178.1 protein kinase [Pseudomonas sp. C32]